VKPPAADWLTLYRNGDLASLQALDAALIVNCTGLSAFGDRELTPVKGQLTVLKPQTEVTYAYLDPVLDLYMFSRTDGVILGGSYGEGVWSTDIDRLRATQILEGNALISGGARVTISSHFFQGLPYVCVHGVRLPKRSRRGLVA